MTEDKDTLEKKTRKYTGAVTYRRVVNKRLGTRFELLAF